MYVILALLLLGVLIIAHEAGHFWAARACGISVQEFSMGMGPLIAKWKSRKGTQFSIRLLPIGGYCQFYGEDEDRPDPRAFNNQAVWKRAVTDFSGPLMNFVIAFLVIALFMSLCGVSVVVPKVAKLEENAQMAGLEIGDEILAVDGMETADSNAVAQAIADSNGDAVTLTVRRDGQTLDLTITPFYDEDDGRYRRRLFLWQGEHAPADLEQHSVLGAIQHRKRKDDSGRAQEHGVQREGRGRHDRPGRHDLRHSGSHAAGRL